MGRNDPASADVAAAIDALKSQRGDDLLVIGSPGLVPLLLAAGLIDEIRLMIDPSCWEAASGWSRMMPCFGPWSSSGAKRPRWARILATYDYASSR